MSVEIAENLARVRSRIEAACVRAGRDPGSVRLLPVTKTLPPERVREAYAAGLDCFGENKVQEARGKSEALADLPVRWSVIGHLQTNKVKYLTRFAKEFQALDSLRVAEALDRRLQAAGQSLDVFVQVNTSREESKFGLPPEEVIAFAKALPAFTALRVRGLMTLAIFSEDDIRVRQCFRDLRAIQQRLLQDGDAAQDWHGLSMGMSGDYEIAVEESATVVRVGQAIFGPRPFPNAYYWPGAQ
ncbi:YggS family pyridoxal phosphate-dependent enzyme [Altericroceibacterium endophyticum]|uniref:Pyridoxal phosphate homeostasis protein n=1 Tax=Altericroceibacterium endophyticum TaxID=1808508 RepID=A0A6I4T308_9SPHN|nr:YggS family pyridoxal phosphate-dependent enzyme [Altericroceibacterium endophyticum]MXO64579.1 YggS family pyridoxal phosphate-dependent enzyme [Altericroceibacterium endophyticum]